MSTPSSGPLAATPATHSAASWNLPGAQAAYEGGRRALRAGFYEPARAIFGALLPHEPDHLEVGISLARTELASGHPVFAESIFDSLDEKAFHLPSLHALRAECALRRGDAPQALLRAFACAEAFPRNPHARYLVARLSWLGGQEAQAEVQFLSLAADSEVGARSCAWAVFCGWRQGHHDEVSALLANLRTDDVVCEGLREFRHLAFGEPWEPTDRVEPAARATCANAWSDLFHRQHASIRSRPAFASGCLLV